MIIWATQFTASESVKEKAVAKTETSSHPGKLLGMSAKANAILFQIPNYFFLF